MRHTYANIHTPPAESNFCEHRNAIKPVTVADYNMHVEHVHKVDRMTVTPSVVGPGNGQRNCSSIYWI
jgi:hypothetical protein